MLANRFAPSLPSSPKQLLANVSHRTNPGRNLVSKTLLRRKLKILVVQRNRLLRIAIKGPRLRARRSITRPNEGREKTKM
jgi:hypothetical protein